MENGPTFICASCGKIVGKKDMFDHKTSNILIPRCLALTLTRLTGDEDDQPYPDFNFGFMDRKLAAYEDDE